MNTARPKRKKERKKLRVVYQLAQHPGSPALPSHTEGFGLHGSTCCSVPDTYLHDSLKIRLQCKAGIDFFLHCIDMNILLSPFGSGFGETISLHPVSCGNEIPVSQSSAFKRFVQRWQMGRSSVNRTARPILRTSKPWSGTERTEECRQIINILPALSMASGRFGGRYLEVSG